MAQMPQATISQYSDPNSPQNLPKIKGFNTAQMPNMPPEMMQLLMQLLGPSGEGAGESIDWLRQLIGGDESGYEDAAHRAFDKRVGQIASRDSHLGARNSSGYRNSIANAGAEMSENMADKRTNLIMQAIQMLMGNSQKLLQQQPFQNFAVPKPQKNQGTDWGSVIGGVGEAVPALANIFGSGAGAAIPAAAAAIL